MENEYVITYEKNGKEEAVTRIETEKDLKDRISYYKEHNIKIKRILKKVVIIRYIEYLDY